MWCYNGGPKKKDKVCIMAVRKTKSGLALKRWFKEKWKDEKGNPCGSSKNKGTKKCRPSKKVSKKTPVTWKGVGKRKAAVVADLVPAELSPPITPPICSSFLP